MNEQKQYIIYIMHLDADAFFASVESAKNPKLRGLPIITGHERGIATSMSYEAKALGINRADPIFKIKKDYPEVQIVAGDYESYAIYSERMMNIVSQYTDDLDTYSIDECFAIIKVNHDNTQDYLSIEKYIQRIISKIQKQIEIELNISVSIGVGQTKLIAKIGSKYNKPHGLTIIHEPNINDILLDLPVGKLWGIGESSAKLLRRHGVETALQFKSLSMYQLSQFANKPLVQLWHEINGRSRIAFGESHIRDNPQSISRTHSFPATHNQALIWSELMRNIENAFYTLRKQKLYTENIQLYIKSKSGQYSSHRIKFLNPIDNHLMIIKGINSWYDATLREHTQYKSTGVTINIATKVIEPTNSQLLSTIDSIGRRYGKHIIHSASSHTAHKNNNKSYMLTHKMSQYQKDGDYKMRHTYLPYLGEAK